MTSQLPDPAIDQSPDNAAMVAAYVKSAQSFIGLVRQAGEDAADKPVPACPAWTIRNLTAHVTSVATLTISGAGFGDDPQATTDREVARRADATLAEIADEWESALPTVQAIFADRPSGPLVVDVVSHEHDLRAALGPEFDDHTSGLPEGLSAMVAWVRYLGLVDEPGVALRTPTSQAVFGGPGIGCEVDLLDDWEMFRLLGVRRSREQLLDYPRLGDESKLFRLTGRYPLPDAPLEAQSRN